MTPLLRHRLYLSARFLAACVAIVTVALLVVVGLHDHLVRRADTACFEEGWAKAPRSAGGGVPDSVFREILARCNVRDGTTQADGFTPDISTRAWRPERGAAWGLWGGDALLALAGVAPLLILIGTRRWLVWLTSPGAPGNE